MDSGSDDAAIDAYVEGAAELCDRMANLFIEGGLPLFSLDEAEGAVWHEDRAAIHASLGTEIPTAWVIRTVPTYLGEAAYQLKAIASVLRARILTGSIGPLVRSITERVGTTTWMLDPEVDSTERAWRTMLNVVVCWSEYRRAAERLGIDPPDQAALEAEHVSLREDVKTWFSPTLGRDADYERAWKRGTSGYPTYTDIAVRSLPSLGPSDPFGEIQRKGLYSAQCGMTHPNVVVSGETVDVDDQGRMRFVHRWEHVDKEIRVGFHSLSWGYRAWAWYFCKTADTPSVMETLENLSLQLDGIAAWVD